MQKKVQIVSDGSLDLPQELTEEKDIEVVGIYQIGASIGVHTGPYPIGIGIIKHAE